MIRKKRTNYIEMMDQYKDISDIEWEPAAVPEVQEHSWYTCDRTKPALEEENIFPCLVFVGGQQCKCVVVSTGCDQCL